jgi:Cu/Zn superoxide dismutase
MFSSDGVSGSMTLTQHSPYDPTEVNVEITGLRQLAGGWHVHDWPVPQRVDSTQQMCSGASVSGHFNPFGIVVADSPPAGTSTEDMYEVRPLCLSWFAWRSTQYNYPVHVYRC